MNIKWKEWISNKIDLLSTSKGAIVAGMSLLAGIMLGKILTIISKGF
jgi:hypothetical protein